MAREQQFQNLSTNKVHAFFEEREERKRKTSVDIVAGWKNWRGLIGRIGGPVRPEVYPPAAKINGGVSRPVIYANGGGHGG